MATAYDTLLENYRNAWQRLRLIREAVETLGPPGILPAEEAVITLYGREPIHEAQAIVDALTAILGDGPDPGTRRRAVASKPREQLQGRRLPRPAAARVTRA